MMKDKDIAEVMLNLANGKTLEWERSIDNWEPCDTTSGTLHVIMLGYNVRVATEPEPTNELKAKAEALDTFIKQTCWWFTSVDIADMISGCPTLSINFGTAERGAAFFAAVGKAMENNWKFDDERDVFLRLVRAWNKADFSFEHVHGHSRLILTFANALQSHDFRKCMVECEAVFGEDAKHNWKHSPSENREAELAMAGFGEKSETGQEPTNEEPVIDPRNPDIIPLGLYLVKSKDGTRSLAAVGANIEGKRWLARTTWIDYRPVSYEHWDYIDSMVPVMLNRDL